MPNGTESPQGDDDRQKYRITVRFGVELLEEGHTAVPNLVLNNYAELGISPAEMMFTIHIWQYWWTERQPFPSLQAVADKMQVSRRQVRNYAQSLKEKALLEVHERYAPGLGQTTSEYDFTRFFQRILEVSHKKSVTPRKDLSEGGRKYLSGGPRKDPSSEEYTGEKDPFEEDATLISNNRQTRTRHKTIDPQSYGKLRVRTNVDNFVAPEPEPVDDGEEEAESAPPAARPGMAKLAAVLDQRQLRPLTPSPRSPGVGRGRPPKAPDYLAATMEDLSAKLHDDAPRSSLTQAVRLWKASGLPEDKFVQRLYEAKSITQQQGSVQGRPAKADTQLRNRVPYFFAVVEDLVGLKDQAQA